MLTLNEPGSEIPHSWVAVSVGLILGNAWALARPFWANK